MRPISGYGFAPFYTCPACREKIPAEGYDAHKAEHSAGNARPEPDAMRTSEVAKVLGISAQAVLYKIAKGKIKALPGPSGRGHPVWVSGPALKRYINEQAKKADVAARWAATGVLDG